MILRLLFFWLEASAFQASVAGKQGIGSDHADE